MSKELSKLSINKQSTISFRKFSTISRHASKALRPVRMYQPTYQLNPRKAFDHVKAQKILQQVVDHELEEVEYNDKIATEYCSTLAENVRNALKEENYDRYRIIVSVTIGQKRQQGVHMFHSFLWDHERDGFASHVFENCHIYCVVSAYAIYLD